MQTSSAPAHWHYQHNQGQCGWTQCMTIAERLALSEFPIFHCGIDSCNPCSTNTRRTQSSTKLRIYIVISFSPASIPKYAHALVKDHGLKQQWGFNLYHFNAMTVSRLQHSEAGLVFSAEVNLQEQIRIPIIRRKILCYRRYMTMMPITGLTPKAYLST